MKKTLAPVVCPLPVPGATRYSAPASATNAVIVASVGRTRLGGFHMRGLPSEMQGGRPCGRPLSTKHHTSHLVHPDVRSGDVTGLGLSGFFNPTPSEPSGAPDGLVHLMSA